MDVITECLVSFAVANKMFSAICTRTCFTDSELSNLVLSQSRRPDENKELLLNTMFLMMVFSTLLCVLGQKVAP